MNYARLSPTMAATIAQTNRDNLARSRSLRKAVLIRRDVIQALRALHWGPTAAGELADIHMRGVKR